MFANVWTDIAVVRYERTCIVFILWHGRKVGQSYKPVVQIDEIGLCVSYDVVILSGNLISSMAVLWFWFFFAWQLVSCGCYLWFHLYFPVLCLSVCALSYFVRFLSSTWGAHDNTSILYNNHRQTKVGQVFLFWRNLSFQIHVCIFPHRSSVQRVTGFFSHCSFFMCVCFFGNVNSQTAKHCRPPTFQGILSPCCVSKC